jgi:hypothetical protein
MKSERIDLMSSNYSRCHCEGLGETPLARAPPARGNPALRPARKTESANQVPTLLAGPGIRYQETGIRESIRRLRRRVLAWIATPLRGSQ